MIGPLLEETLVKIEEAMWEFEAKAPTTMPDYTKPCLRAAAKIFSSVLFEFSYKHLNAQGWSNETIEQTVEELGFAIRELIYKYTELDTHVMIREYLDNYKPKAN